MCDRCDVWTRHGRVVYCSRRIEPGVGARIVVAKMSALHSVYVLGVQTATGLFDLNQEADISGLGLCDCLSKDSLFLFPLHFDIYSPLDHVAYLDFVLDKVFAKPNGLTNFCLVGLP